MSKTNIRLVAHAEKALKEEWYYGWGAYGQIAVAALLTSLINQYSGNAGWRTYMMGAVTAGTRLCDCYGLIKSYLWWTDDNSNPKYNSAQDRNTAGAYNAANEKGLLSTLPEIPGIILYMPGHVGVYCGNGRFIELMGGGVGAYEGRIVNKVITKGSKFTHWFKDVNITYIDAEEKEVDEVVDTTNIKVNGKTGIVSRILKDGSNYIKLSDLGDFGFAIGYDANVKLPELVSPDKPDTTATEIIIDGEKYVVNRIFKDGKNYVELQGLAQAGFTVGYNAVDKVPELGSVKG